MEMFGIAVVEGIVVGSIYTIAALGFVLIFKSTKVINFAQGELMMIGAYVAYLFRIQIGMNMLSSFLATLVITAALGIIIHYALFKKMIGESPFTLVMVTIALSYLLKSGAQLIWGAQSKVMPSMFTGPNVQIMNIPVSRDAIAVVLFALIFLVFFQLFFKFSKLGTAMRATANDQVASMGCGVQVNVIFAASWAISFMLSSVGGVIMAETYNLDNNLGIVGLLVFPVIILGGLDSIVGAIVGGYIIGLLESFSKAYLGQYFSTNVDVIPFAILIFILLVKPYGLFGTTRIERL
ncbi:MAG: branched-chain amino acid ABC transporter permease [Deltaproteobacteria bacterium]|nr:branched-chain amino acid ABC transporter permease [Deltaproteobacteria bacterium]